MSNPEIEKWFDATWMRERDRALRSGWEALARRDQVLVAVGFLLDSCVGDGEWAVVDGVVDGNDEGLTARMPDALEEVGLSLEADLVRQIIRLRKPTGSPRQDAINRDEALGHWQLIEALFERGMPEERVMLTQLYDWYQARAEEATAPSVAAPKRRSKKAPNQVKTPRKKGRGQHSGLPVTRARLRCV